jgi:ribosomal protein S18 acetylase RimI-like enzyme
MPRIEVRTAVLEDITAMMELDHSYHTDYVWQMDVVSEDKYVGINFQENRLPRSVKVEYPRLPKQLFKDWIHRDALLVGVLDKKPVAYISVSLDLAPSSAWITDLAVSPINRRGGIATALVMAAEEWASSKHLKRMIVDMQSKNTPGVKLFRKFGYDFCGYNDHFYSNQDIALFFSHYLI